MVKKNKFTEDDDALLSELGIEVEEKKAIKYTKKEERVIAGFEEIQKFVEDNNRLPQHGENNDIFERLYAVRLERIRKLPECHELLKAFDTQNILTIGNEYCLKDLDNISDDDLLDELGVSVDIDNSITTLRHVKPRSEINSAEDVAKRKRCENFEEFKPLFEKVKKDIDAGIRETKRFRKDAGFSKTDVQKGNFIVIGGQMSYVANVGEVIKAPNGETDARLRVIYSNGMESDILLRSLIRAMYKDETSRLVSDISAGPLFSNVDSETDLESGTIYVLRSLSNIDQITQNRDLVHKIGVTGSAVEKRINNAKNDPTFLMSDVEVVATYKLSNINRVKLENLIHSFFSNARLDIEIIDRFGKPVKAREWFLVPLFIINEVVDRILDGTISDYFYDPKTASLKLDK